MEPEDVASADVFASVPHKTDTKNLRGAAVYTPDIESCQAKLQAWLKG